MGHTGDSRSSLVSPSGPFAHMLLLLVAIGGCTSASVDTGGGAAAALAVAVQGSWSGGGGGGGSGLLLLLLLLRAHACGGAVIAVPLSPMALSSACFTSTDPLGVRTRALNLCVRDQQPAFPADSADRCEPV